MNKIIKTIKSYFGEMTLVAGVGIFTYNVFNFSYKGGYGGEYRGILPKLPPFKGYEFEYVVYYYPTDTILLVTIGAILIISGLLIIKRRNEK